MSSEQPVAEPSIHPSKLQWLTLRRIGRIFLDYPAPLAIVGLIVVSIVLRFAGFDGASRIAAGIGIVIGAVPLVRTNIAAIRRGNFALDYIAFLAIGLSIATGEELVGAIIALMVVGGESIEAYGVRRAGRSLTLLADRIPSTAIVVRDDMSTVQMPVDSIEPGSAVLVRHGEVVPLDGLLVDEHALIDESSLTGEPYQNDKYAGDEVRSGTVNIGPTFTITINRKAADSTYRKILSLVAEAQQGDTPLVRLADRYSYVFTAFTLAIAAGASWLSGDVTRALAVLVVATPCPLILAPPIALMGGMNWAAHEKVIVKRFAALEVLSRISALIFDKTGTLTMGKPEITSIEVDPQSGYTEEDVLQMAATLERHSLHPLAKVITSTARQRNLPVLTATGVREVAGSHLEGWLDGKHLVAGNVEHRSADLVVGLQVDGQLVATILFGDPVKSDSAAVLERLSDLGIELAIATGDRREPAERAVAALNVPITIEADCTPQDKTRAIIERQKAGHTVGMVGDGINDAPALAQADVGLMFAHEEQTAATEAADVILLGGDVESVWKAVVIARKAVGVAQQAIVLGMSLSIGAMMLAAFGLVVPLFGALLQEVIDIVVIFYALRAASTGTPDEWKPQVVKQPA